MRNKEDLVPANLCSRYLIPREEQHLFHVLQERQAIIGGKPVTTTWIKCYRPCNYKAFEKIQQPGSKIDLRAATGCTKFELIHDPRLELRKAEVEKRKKEKEVQNG